MNPDKPSAAPDQLPSSSPVLQELSGYIDIGMRQEALALARRLLKATNQEPEVFNAAVEALLVHQTRLKSVQGPVEGAYQRLKKKDRRKVRSSMLGFYVSLNDTKKALPFATLHPKTAHELFFSFDVFLGQNQKEKVDRLARMGLRMLRRGGRSEETPLFSVLADYQSSKGSLDAALEIWRLIPDDQSLTFNKHESMVLNRVALAIKTIHESLTEITAFEQHDDPSLAISHPDLHSKMVAHIKKRLEKYQHDLEKILPRKDWERFALNAPG